MWKLTEEERKIYRKIIPTDFPTEQTRIHSDKTIANGLSVDELINRDRISSSEVEEIYKVLPSDTEFYKFVDSLKPHQQFSEPALTEEQKEAKREYKERIQRLKNQQANLEYNNMIRSIDQTRSNPLLQNFGQEMREMNRQMVAVINTLITVGGSFAFGFWGVQFAYPHLGLDIAERMLLGLVCATIVFFADLYFIVKSMSDDEIDEKNKNKMKKKIWTETTPLQKKCQ
uniref:Transmembrane protein 199 n=1 Tax=Meloidogyne hapla TaxID=6305 RepID=A0A1I8BMD4_MELHA